MGDYESSTAVHEAVWYFSKLLPGDPERNPHEDEFFHYTPAYEALVREVIQNSLDARDRDADRKCCVRFTFGYTSKENIQKYLDDLLPHIKACNYLPNEYASLQELNFLNIEDFGTVGLDGDTGDSGTRPNDSNFYNFWKREGISGKSESEGGRWGLGKTAFHAASKLRSFWGLTIRSNEPKELLRGKALLKIHEINGDYYNYWGYFCTDSQESIVDNKYISDFKKTFSISRSTEKGFSLIIPLPLEGIDKQTIIRSAIIHYFYPIIKGMLTVEIVELSDPANSLTLDASTIIDLARSQDWHDTMWARKKDKEIEKLLQFVKETESALNVDVNNDQTTGLTASVFGDQLDELKKSFSTGNIIAFKIPVRISKIGKIPNKSFFTIYIQKDREIKRSDEHYIRSGISIFRIHELGNRPVRGLLVAEDRPVAEFLGDCEEPAHTEWNERSETLKDKYDNPKATLRFVKKSMLKIVSFLDEPPEGRSNDLLADIFHVPKEDIEEDANITTQPIVNVPTKSRIFKILSEAGGFTISASNNIVQVPFKAIIRVAYDTRRKNPFSQYDINDFNLSNYHTITQGCTIESQQKNIIVVNIENNDFKIEVTGFDPERDLVIKAEQIKEEEE